MNTNTSRKIVVDWQPLAAGLPDDSILVLIALDDDDVRAGFLDGDIWRYADAMPIEQERVTHWARMPDPPTAECAAAPVVLLPLNDHTRMILGRPNFACSFTARRMRELGHSIPKKAEEEQAAVIHLMLTMYQQHGADWFEHANAYLEGGHQPAASAVEKAAA